MLRLLSIFIFSFLINAQDKAIKLNSDPSEKNTVKITLKLRLENGIDGYYDGASASKMPNGNYAVLDRGNKQLFIFDKTGKIIRKFGKEGNGPGEFSNPYRVFTTSKHIYVRQNMVVIMFDNKGTYVKDISIMSSGKSGTPMIHKDQLILVFTGNTADRIVYFDEEGNIAKKVANTEYVHDPENANSRSVSISSNFTYASDGNYFYRVNDGTYSIDVLDANFNVLTHYTKEFSRVVNDYSGVKINVNGDNMTDKERAQRIAAIMNNIKKKYGEYYSDAASVIGIKGKKIFIQIADADDTHLSFHVLENDTFLDEYTLKVNGEVSEARIVNNDLLLTYKNDEEGPVVEVYSIN